MTNAYALSRPPSHHCLPDYPNGFCLMANIAIHAAMAEDLCARVAVIDWDVHHGNGTEAIFYDQRDVPTISLHQDHNYPLDTGDANDTGSGSGHATYIEAMQRLVRPAIARLDPGVIVVACGYDAASVDPLGRMLATAETFRALTEMTMAREHCNAKLVLVDVGGHSEVYVPFCRHAVRQQLSASTTIAPNPLADTFAARQPAPDLQRYQSSVINTLHDFFF